MVRAQASASDCERSDNSSVGCHYRHRQEAEHNYCFER